MNAIGKIDSCDSSTTSSQSAGLSRLGGATRPSAHFAPAMLHQLPREGIEPSYQASTSLSLCGFSLLSGLRRPASQHVRFSLPFLPSQWATLIFFKLLHIDTATPPARPSYWDGLRRWCLTKLRWPCKSLLSPRGSKSGLSGGPQRPKLHFFSRPSGGQTRVDTAILTPGTHCPWWKTPGRRSFDIADRC